MFAYALVIFLLAWYKLTQFIRMFGLEFSITQTCLTFQIISAMLRVILSVCPTLFNPLFSSATSLTLTGVADSLMFSSVLLMAMYWSDMLNNFSHFRSGSVKFIHSHKRCYNFITIPMIILMVIISILAGLNIFVFLELLWAIITLIVSFFYGVYFTIVGYQILKVVKTMGQASKTELYTQMNRAIISIGVSNLLYLLMVVLTLTPASGGSPAAYITLIFLNYLCSWTISLSVVLSFHIKYATAQQSGTPMGSKSEESNGRASRTEQASRTDASV